MRVFLVIVACLALLFVLCGKAVAGDRDKDYVCKGKDKTATVKCLAKEKGLGVNVRKAVKVLHCESGSSPDVVSPVELGKTKYFGVYQLLKKEYKVFSHQGPKWLDREFRRNSRFSIKFAWSNIAATLAHSKRFGWDWSSCA